MNRLLYIVLFWSTALFAQVDCHQLPENYTGTCTANYDNGVIAKEYTFKDGKVIAAKEYSTFGELERTIAIEDERKLSFTESLYRNGGVLFSTLTLTNGDGEHPALDAEAIRIISKMPKWKPGKVGKKKVRTRCMVPINFVLE